jgi:ABC-type anion transport system duplicated permease subunit
MINIEFLRPIFYTILLFSFFIMLASIIKKKSNQASNNNFYIYTFSVFSIVIASITMFQIGVIADETGKAGDPQSFYLFISIVVINIMNILFSLFKQYVSR